MFKKALVTMLTGMMILSCACANSDVDKTSPNPVKKDVKYCAAAEAHLQDLCSKDSVKNKLCCDMVRVTPKQKTFEQVCETVQQAGIYVNPRCIASVTSCAQVDKFCMQSNTAARAKTGAEPMDDGDGGI